NSRTFDSMRAGCLRPENSSPMRNFDVIVVGSGIAGLTSAALLARDGARVLMLEHHDKPGGCAGYFSVPSKFGAFTFPTGATVALGLENGGLHLEIFEKLGVACPSVPIDRLAVFLPDLSVNLWHDAAKWRLERQKLPGNRRGQELFWRLQELIADAGWFALGRKPALPLQKPIDLWRNLPLAHPKMAPMLAALPFSVGEAMRWLQVDRDRAFCALVNLQLLITTQSLSHAAPLSNGMAGLDLWRHGAHHPRGGLGAIAQKLLEGFQKHGGQAKFGAKVVQMRQKNGVWEVETANGEVFSTMQLIANVPLHNLNFLLESPPKSIQKLEKRAGSGWGAVTLYCAVRDEAIPANFPLHAQVLTRYHSTPPFLKAGAGDDVFLSLSLSGDELAAPRGWRTLNVSTHIRWQDWQGLPKLEYRAKKREWREKLLAGVRVALPYFEENRGFIITGTPSTWESYTLRSGGSVGGAALTRRNANLRALPSRIGLPNFHLVGDTTFPGQGTVACALSGFNAWRDIRIGW
ncbi:MAG TPA: NAD(P)/FAD-dependent oxidoreductase, partial [Abditibacterium sp.]